MRADTGPACVLKLETRCTALDRLWPRQAPDFVAKWRTMLSPLRELVAKFAHAPVPGGQHNGGFISKDCIGFLFTSLLFLLPQKEEQNKRKETCTGTSFEGPGYGTPREGRRGASLITLGKMECSSALRNPLRRGIFTLSHREVVTTLPTVRVLCSVVGIPHKLRSL